MPCWFVLIFFRLILNDFWLYGTRCRGQPFKWWPWESWVSNRRNTSRLKIWPPPRIVFSEDLCYRTSLALGHRARSGLDIWPQIALNVWVCRVWTGSLLYVMHLLLRFFRLESCTTMNAALEWIWQKVAPAYNEIEYHDVVFKRGFGVHKDSFSEFQGWPNDEIDRLWDESYESGWLLLMSSIPTYID